jgi:hypothetical protein
MSRPKFGSKDANKSMAKRLLKGSTAAVIKIEIVGSDLVGQQFIERTETLTVTRDGATILLKIKLAPESELIVRNMATNEEALARVVGHIREEASGHVYGIALVNPPADLWRVSFPPADTGEETLLECSSCHTVRAVALSEIEMEIFESERALSRHCECSSSVTLWKQTERAMSSEQEKILSQKNSGTEPAAPVEREKRRDRRTAMKRAACIRHSGKEEVVVCEDMSRGGFRFKSRKQYPEGTKVEAAVPYEPSNVNIFVPARIAYHQTMPDGSHRHGVSYIKTGGNAD